MTGVAIGTARRGGVVPLYRDGVECPWCGGRSWHVGRSSAECGRASCAMVLDLEVGGPRDWGVAIQRGANPIPARP